MSEETEFGNGELLPAEGDTSRLEAFLPTDNVQNHAANLLPLPNGDLLCVWFSGTQEGMSDISVYSARLLAGSERWSDLRKLSEDSTRSAKSAFSDRKP